jgi:hypothetical protein
MIALTAVPRKAAARPKIARRFPASQGFVITEVFDTEF